MGTGKSSRCLNTKGAKNSTSGSSPLFVNGHVTYEGIAAQHNGIIHYVKIGTSDEGLIKIIDGTRESYRTDGIEKARLIFRRDASD